MIKNSLNKIILGAVVVSTSLFGSISEYEFQTKSLAGVEAGYGALDYENLTSINNEQYTIKSIHAGLKLGAETEDFRVFISGRYYFDSSDDCDYITTYGVELQYKLNISENMNLFLGGSTGIANMKFQGKGETFSRTISDAYIGGDLGANIHITEALDWEIGARVISIQAENTRNSVTYNVGNLVSGYTSLIFKWQMD